MRAKYTHYFNLWVRADGDVMDFESFSQLFQRVVKLTDVKADNEAYWALYQETVQIWAGIAEFADTNNDGYVTLDEWLAYSEALVPLIKPMALANQPIPVGDFMFKLMDKNGDGIVERDDWAIFIVAYGIQENPEEHFGWLDLNGDGHITHDEWSQLIYGWGLSEVPTDSVNLLFGRFQNPYCPLNTHP